MKKQKILAIFMSIIMFASLLPADTVLADNKPILNNDSYYEISSSDDLYWFMEYVNAGNTSANAILTADITVNENLLESLVYDENKTVTNGDSFTEWFPIGYYYDRNDDGKTEEVYYNGIFDGQGHTISGLYFSSDEQTGVGLFGFLAEGSEIRNVNISDSYLFSLGYVGGIAGDNNKGRIENCSFDGIITGAGSLGGICGYNYRYSAILGCSNSGEIYGMSNGYNDLIGGICGWNEGLVSDCHNSGDVSGVLSVGGVCGENYGNACMTELSSNSGNVEGRVYVGGICGYHHGSTVINHCYNSGNVTCTEYNAGGIVGSLSFAYIRSSHNVADVKGPYYVGGISGNTNDRSSILNNYYLSGCAVANETTVQNGMGSEDNSLIEDIEGKIIAASAEDFISGKIADLLNNRTIGAQIWKQNIDNGKESDAFPGFVGGGVYFEGDEYTNYCKFIDEENGFLQDDYGAMYYEPAVWNEAEKHYEISNAGQLYWFMEYSNRYFSYITIAENSADHLNAAEVDAVLTKDIVVNENLLENIEYGTGGMVLNKSDFIEWTPVGRRFYIDSLSGMKVYMSVDYNGSFDGQGHTISGLYLDDENELYGGLFGDVANIYMSHLGVEDSYIRSQTSGGICALYNSGRIEDCYFRGTVKGISASGGILGINGSGQYQGGSVKNCYTIADVSSSTYAGAICGNNSGTYAEYDNCYYLAGKAFGGGVKQNGLGSQNNTAVSDTDSGIASKTTSQFASGEVAYSLNNPSEKDTGIWHQNIDNETAPDSYPGFTGASVYRTGNSGNYVYSNVNDNYTDNSNDTIFSDYEAVTYEISDADDLYAFMERVNAGDGYANAVLTNDIVVNENLLKSLEYDGYGNVTNGDSFREWFPIGYVYDRDDDGSTEFVDFKGNFDGQGHTISGLYFNNIPQSYVGLFGSTSCDAVIRNVTVADSYLKNSGTIAAICSSNSGLIENCHNRSKVVAQNYVGGICTINTGIIKNCTNISDISGSGSLGGICAQSVDAVITECVNTGNITGTSNYIGGIVATSYSGTIENCINRGNISGRMSAGGICSSNTGTAVNSYSTGEVTADSYAGAICGGTSGIIKNTYYLADEETDSIDGTTAKTEAEFASGEVAYLLNNGTGGIFAVWHQNIDNGEEADLYPAFSGGVVCRTGEEGGYTYTNSNDTEAVYEYDENGFFGENIYEPAVWNDDKNCYEISNAGQLYWFSEYTNKTDSSANAQLTADITVNMDLLDNLKTDENENILNGELFREWIPISRYNGYKGSFNGMGYSISGLYYNNSLSFTGLFGRAEASAEIKNVNIYDSYFNSNTMTGGICGYNNGLVANCDYSGEISGNTYSGGICGYSNKSVISNCNNHAAMLGDKMGGICGFNGEYNSVKSCINRGEIVASGSEIGGIVGTNEGLVENCTNRADVSVRKKIYNMGGICGDNCGIVRNCYNGGDIEGSNWGVGGIIGTNSTGLVENCTNDGAISGHTYIGGICGQSGGTVIKSSNSGKVIGDYSIGGILGLNNGGFAKNCGNVGDISGGYYIGGVCGHNKSGSINTARLANCYSVGDVSGTNYNTGSICGSDEGAIRNCYYLENSAGIGNKTQNGIGTADNTPYIDIKIVVLAKSREAFESGEITYLLNNSVTDDTNVWHQDLDNGNIPDDYPVLFGAKVYRTGANGEYTYSNMGDTGSEDENGTIIDYEISDVGELYEFMEYVNTGNVGSDSVNAVLTADIVINESIEYDSYGNVINADTLIKWFPVGYMYDRNSDGEAESITYNGTFDGRGYSITGLYFDNSKQDYVGLFGIIGDSAIVKNVNIINSYISGDSYFGGICGYSSGEIKNCSADGIIEGGGFGGGIVGASSGLITKCHNNLSVTGTGNAIGGICGYADSGSIEKCSNAGKVSTDGSDSGGICGYNESTIKNCLNQGEIHSTDSNAGGICGYNSGEIRSSYNTASVKCDFHAGGICGYNESGKLVNCYYLQGCAASGIFKQNGIGTEFNIPASDVDGQTTGKAEESFVSGEVTYLLNSGITSGRQVWYQTIGENTAPVYNGETVYFDGNSQPQYFNKIASAMSQGAFIEISQNQISATGIDRECVLIIALYSENTMLGVRAFSTDKDISVAMNEPESENADTVKVMLWNNLNECIPLCENEYYTLN